MKMNTARFVSWLILDGWQAYRHKKYQADYHVWFHKPGHRVYGYISGGSGYRHGYQAPSKEPEPSQFDVVPWAQVGMHDLASLRRVLRKEGLL